MTLPVWRQNRGYWHRNEVTSDVCKSFHDWGLQQFFSSPSVSASGAAILVGRDAVMLAFRLAGRPAVVLGQMSPIESRKRLTAFAKFC